MDNYKYISYKEKIFVENISVIEVLDLLANNEYYYATRKGWEPGRYIFCINKSVVEKIFGNMIQCDDIFMERQPTGSISSICMIQPQDLFKEDWIVFTMK